MKPFVTVSNHPRGGQFECRADLVGETLARFARPPLRFGEALYLATGEPARVGVSYQALIGACSSRFCRPRNYDA